MAKLIKKRGLCKGRGEGGGKSRTFEQDSSAKGRRREGEERNERRGRDEIKGLGESLKREQINTQN
ncbi:MAG: hypothetical protein K2K81_09180 [Muribaculaceae bacterium]|nr:hypothetical protein [Muribaculaceae bacterium]